MAWQHTLKARWMALAPRERRGLLLAATALGLLLAWSLLLAPALRTLKTVQAQRASLQAQMERMLSLQARAQQLQARPLADPQETLKALQAAVAALGKQASLQTSADRITVTLQQLEATALAPWLTPGNGLPSPIEARLQRDTAGASGNAAAKPAPAPAAANAAPNPASTAPPVPGTGPTGPAVSAGIAPAGGPARAASPSGPTWSGTLVFPLAPAAKAP